MGDEGGGGAKVDPTMFLNDWFKERVVSSLKCKPESADALINGEGYANVATFFNEEETGRLLVMVVGNDLVAVR